MITVITGLTGSGKTFLMTRLALRRRKKGEDIYPNMGFNFPNDNEGVYRWHALSETYGIKNGTICIDEGQKYFDAHFWKDLPMSFSLKIASHRHHLVDIITTTQDFGHIDIRVRQNVHEQYNCQSLFRYPKSDRKKPLIQIVKVVKKIRSHDDTNGLKFIKAGVKRYYISKYWTKQLYDTYANIDLSHFICQIKREKKKWLIVLQSRQLSKKG
jgi:hypothetical protein